ncbi:MAG: bifunctional phosphoglucose/phosphomannose isomerase, partial [Chloroflexi bacterium]|nr:bifunctional phosphoglucose/phosphomannose isomerase [Chloroflexota bacterium]
MAGDLASDLAATQGTVPILVVRDPHLPFVVDRRTLFVACSYSGNTEETLSLFDQAARAQASMLAIGSGGALARKAADNSVPFITVDIATEPRCAVGYNLMLILGALRRVGILKLEEQEALGAVEALTRRVSALEENVPLAENRAKQLAVALHGKLIVIYGSGLFSGVARRWKTQINENAKAWAFYETLPELLHNSVEAYPSRSNLADQTMTLLLQPALDEVGYGRHVTVVADLLRRNNLAH